MSALRMRSLGLLGLLPLVAVAIVVISLAWSHTTGPPIYAAESTGLELDQQQAVDQAQIPDIGSTTLLQHESVITTSTDDGSSAADLQAKGVIGNGTDPGAGVAPATVEVNDNNGITDFSAIPIVGDGINNVSEIYLVAIIGAVLLSATAIAGFDYVKMRTRRQRRLDVPIARTTADGTPTDTLTDPDKRLRTMGRTALNSLTSVTGTVWTWATSSWAKATRTPASA